MKKIAISLIVLTFSLIAKPTDVYFANGILTSKEQAKDNAELLRKRINRPDVPKVHVAYNHSYDLPLLPKNNGGFDLFESLRQKLSLTRLVDSFVQAVTKNKYTTTHKLDLDKQVAQYQQSIEQGHKVLAVAHSQGNLFTNEAYGKIDEMGYSDFFDAVSIASPMFSSIKEDTKNFSWDNDLVADLALNPLRKRYKCAVRKVEWLKNRTYPHPNAPQTKYIYDEDKVKVYKDDWIPKEPLVNAFDSNVHAFTFYIGEALKDGDTDKPYYEVFQGRELKTVSLKEHILDEIDTILDKNSAITNPSNPDAGGETDTNSTTGGTNPSETFDYRSQCSSIDFPDPIPSELEVSINDIITNAGSTIAAPIVCPLIDTVVKAYNLQHSLPGGGIPSPF
jgi:hypothetical protein